MNPVDNLQPCPFLKKKKNPLNFIIFRQNLEHAKRKREVTNVLISEEKQTPQLLFVYPLLNHYFCVSAIHNLL